MAKLGSHNTMTYLPVKQWYLKPFYWMSRCQSKNIKEQSKYTDFFDIRVRFDKNNNPVFAHGFAEYKFSYEVFKFLDKKAHSKVMLSLEWSKKKNLDRQKILFAKLCRFLESNYIHIAFCGGAVKYDWSVVYKFYRPLPDYTQYVSSTTGSKIDDIYPRLFALMNNHKALTYGRNHEYVNVDFIHTV